MLLKFVLASVVRCVRYDVSNLEEKIKTANALQTFKVYSFVLYMFLILFIIFILLKTAHFFFTSYFS